MKSKYEQVPDDNDDMMKMYLLIIIHSEYFVEFMIFILIQWVNSKQELLQLSHQKQTQVWYQLGPDGGYESGSFCFHQKNGPSCWAMNTKKKNVI